MSGVNYLHFTTLVIMIMLSVMVSSMVTKAEHNLIICMSYYKPCDICKLIEWFCVFVLSAVMLKYINRTINAGIACKHTFTSSKEIAWTIIFQSYLHSRCRPVICDVICSTSLVI